MQRRLEQSVIDNFFKKCREYASSNNLVMHDYALNGQDKNLRADYFFSTEAWFSMIEFKYSETQIKEEWRNKEEKFSLCHALSHDDKASSFHECCHYIAWSCKIMQNYRDVMLNIYKCEVCAQNICRRVSADTYISDFFYSKHGSGLQFSDFKYYVDWICGHTDQGGSGEIHLLVYDKGTSFQVEIKGINNLKAWLDAHSPRPGPQVVGPGPDQSGPSGPRSGGSSPSP